MYKNILYFHFPNILNQVISFFIIIIAANKFNNYEFGVFTFAQNIFFILFSLSFSNIYMFLQYKMVKNFEKRKKDISTCFVIHFTASLINFIIILAIISVFDIDYKIKTIIIIISLILVSEPFSLPYNYFFIKKDYKTIFQVRLTQILIFFIIKLLILFYSKSILLFTLTYLLENIYFSILIIKRYLDNGNNFFNFILDKNYIIQVLKKIYIFPFISFATLLAMKIDIIMISSINDFSQSGYYSAASRTITALILLKLVFFSYIYPDMTKKYLENKNYDMIYRVIIFVIFISSLIITCFFILFGDIYLELWGPNFSTAKIPLVILALNIFPSLVANIWIQKKFIQNQYMQIFFYQVISIILNILLNISFIKLYGVTGAAIATIFSNIITFLIVNIFSVNELKLVVSSFHSSCIKETARRIFSIGFKNKKPETNDKMIK